MTNPDNRPSWMYDVHVYPKNDKQTKPHKAVLDGEGNVLDQSAVKIGDELTYRVSSIIPNYGDVVGPLVDGVYGAPGDGYNGWDLQSFYVRDVLPSEVTYQAPVSVHLVASGVDATTTTHLPRRHLHRGHRLRRHPERSDRPGHLHQGGRDKLGSQPWRRRSSSDFDATVSQSFPRTDLRQRGLRRARGQAQRRRHARTARRAGP